MALPTNLPQTGLIGSEQALRGGLQQGLDAIAGGYSVGSQALQPYTSAGAGAINQMANLSGAAGLPAQQQAFANFQASPEQEYLRERGRIGLLRSSAATGGLGGGNVLEELQRRGIGEARQDLENSFNRLGSVASYGQPSAATQAQMASRAGEVGGRAYMDTGSNLAAGRTQAAQDIAKQTSATGSALAGLVQQQGQSASDLISGTSGNLANILAGQGAADAKSQEELAKLLANINISAGGQMANIPALSALQSDKGMLGQIGEFAAGMGTAIPAVAALSDIRLKTNINKIGQTKSGINLYTWDWNEMGQSLTGMVSSAGVLAQELMMIKPHAVIEDDTGYLKVNYNEVY